MTNSNNKSGSAGMKTALSRSGGLLAAARVSVLIGFVLSVLAPSWAEAQEANEYEVKAAFLYNFARFVEWPGNTAADPVVIGILGNDPFGGGIDRAVEGKTVNGRRMAIKRFSSLEAYEYCHILFISSSERSNLNRILAVVRDTSVLTVSETDRFAQMGGIINFITIENKIRFEINQSAAARAGLKISSKLLSLGRVVRT